MKHRKFKVTHHLQIIVIQSYVTFKSVITSLFICTREVDQM